jgi:hypothetical protein
VFVRNRPSEPTFCVRGREIVPLGYMKCANRRLSCTVGMALGLPPMPKISQHTSMIGAAGGWAAGYGKFYPRGSGYLRNRTFKTK